MLVLAPDVGIEIESDTVRGPRRTTPVYGDEPTGEPPNSVFHKFALGQAVNDSAIERIPGIFCIDGVPSLESLALTVAVVKSTYPCSNTQVLYVANLAPGRKGKFLYKKICRDAREAICDGEHVIILVDNLQFVSGAYELIISLALLTKSERISFVLSWDDADQRGLAVKRAVRRAVRSGTTVHGIVRYGNYPRACGEEFSQFCSGTLFPDWAPPGWVHGRLNHWAKGNVRRLRLYVEMLHAHHLHTEPTEFTPVGVSQFLSRLANVFFGEPLCDFAEALAPAQDKPEDWIPSEAEESMSFLFEEDALNV